MVTNCRAVSGHLPAGAEQFAPRLSCCKPGEGPPTWQPGRGLGTCLHSLLLDKGPCVGKECQAEMPPRTQASSPSSALCAVEPVTREKLLGDPESRHPPTPSSTPVTMDDNADGARE